MALKTRYFIKLIINFCLKAQNNFVFGLKGETKHTYDLDYEFLKNIIDEDLLLRRINLRQIIPIPGTKMFDLGNKIISKNKGYFQQFKRKVRENIEQPMLKKVLPAGTFLRDVYTEKYEGKLTFSRQIGSYPLLIGIPGVHPLKEFVDVKIVDYGYRSITGIPYPLDINIASREILESIPGVGKKRAIRILANRPFKNKEELIKALDEENLMDIIQNYVSI